MEGDGNSYDKATATKYFQEAVKIYNEPDSYTISGTAYLCKLTKNGQEQTNGQHVLYYDSGTVTKNLTVDLSFYKGDQNGNTVNGAKIEVTSGSDNITKISKETLTSVEGGKLREYRSNN